MLPSSDQTCREMQRYIKDDTPHRHRLFRNFYFYLRQVEVLQICGNELEVACLPSILDREPGAEVRPCPFPRLRSLYWTIAQRQNHIRNLTAFHSCPQLIRVVIDLNYAPPELNSYVHIHVLVREMRKLFVHLKDIAITTTGGDGEGFLPSSVLRLCEGLASVAIKADVKREFISFLRPLYSTDRV